MTAAAFALAALPASGQELEATVTAAPLALWSSEGGPEATLRLIEVTDQRCPSDLACYWEGTKRAVLSVKAGGVAETVVLCNLCDDGGPEAVAGAWRLSFVDLDPPVAAIEALGRPATVADYALRVAAVPGP